MISFIVAHPVLTCLAAFLVVCAAVCIACAMGAPISRDEDEEDTWP